MFFCCVGLLEEATANEGKFSVYRRLWMVIGERTLAPRAFICPCSSDSKPP
jgi:hypothetical protein